MTESAALKEFIAAVVAGRDLTAEEAERAMDAIMSGEATPAQVAAFIVALRMKGETIEEITGCARAMRAKAMRVDPGSSGFMVVDTCGTGGDAKHTFNISTAAALVAAGAGVTVAKHGNRSVSSRCGSADVLRALGVNVEAERNVVERCLREVKFGFLFAPMLHGAMKHAIGPRREIGVRTIFNILGPLTNPAGAPCQILGVYDDALVETLALVLRNLGSHHCLVVHGADGLDEISIGAPTHVAELHDGVVRTYMLAPEDVGMERADPSALRVESVEEAAQALREVLRGARGPLRDIVLLNAAAAIMVSGAAASVVKGLRLAEESLDSGAARRVLESLIEITNSPA